MPRLLSRAGVALLCVLTSLKAGAAEDTASAVAAFGDAQQVPIDLSGPVSLQNCIAQALGRNFAVRIQQFTVFQAVDSVAIQEAAFEPTFILNTNRQATHQATDQITVSAVPYSNYTTDTASFSVNDTLITGGTLTAGYNLVRSDISPSYGPPNPAYQGEPSITLTQPLLQGAGTDYSRALIESARLGVKISNLNFRSTVLTMIFNVETTYYNLLYQREQYKVQEDELKQAQQLLDENTTKRETGVLTDLDVMNARAGVAAAKNQLILDMQAVHNSEDVLLQDLGDRQFQTTVGEIPFPDIGEPDVSFARSYKLARDNGPNLAVVQATIDQFKLQALRARRNTLPSLNVNGGLGYGSYTGSTGDALTGPYNGYNWTAGVTLSIPWGMKAAKATYHQALAQVHSEEVAFDQADQNLVVNVRAAVRGVETSIQTVHSSAENALYANKAYELTKAQFDAGLATSYLVLQAQNTLETARVSELQAKVNLLVAVANLRFFEGSSLQLYRINLPE
jgi:outer membrane protein